VFQNTSLLNRTSNTLCCDRLGRDRK